MVDPATATQVSPSRSVPSPQVSVAWVSSAMQVPFASWVPSPHPTWADATHSVPLKAVPSLQMTLTEAGYAGLGNAVVNDLMAVKNASSATIISLLGRGSAIANSFIGAAPSKDFSAFAGTLGLEVRSVPMRAERAIGVNRATSQ